MMLDEIPPREVVLIDANIFLYALERASEQCTRFLIRCSELEVFGFITSHILAEVMHRLMMAEARDNNWITRANPARQLSHQPEKIRKLHRYSQVVKGLLASGVQFEPVQAADFIIGMQAQQEFGLLTNDSILVAVADRLGIKAIASSDKMLASLKGIKVYSPGDLV